LYSVLRANVSSRLAQQRVLADGLGEEGNRQFEKRVRDFIASCRRRKITPVLCTFATAYQEEDLNSAPRPVVDNLFRYNIYLSFKGWAKSIHSFNRVLENVAREEHLVLIDVNGAYGGKPALFRDMWHFTPEAHALVGRTIAEALDRTTDGVL